MAKSSKSRRPVKAQRKPRSKDLPHLHVQPNPGFAEAFFQANAEILKQAARNAKQAQIAQDAQKPQTPCKEVSDPSPTPPAKEARPPSSLPSTEAKK